jgi:transposase-like protein
MDSFQLAFGRYFVAKQRNSDREAFWRGALKRRVDSGMTITEFCSREGLKPTAYHYWQRQIKRRDGALQPQNANGGSETALLPVQIVEDRGFAAAVEIVAKNGYVIRVSEQATTEQVRRVLEAVGELR